MEKEILKELRNKLPVTLKEAIELLKKNDGDIQACEEDFHRLKVLEICRETDCEVEKANRFYKKFNFDKEKAIRGINEEQLVLTTGEPQIGKNAIGFILYFEDENGEPYKTVKRNDIFIPTMDFDYIIEEFKSNCSENFDIRAHNYFDRAQSELIMEGIDRIETKKQNVIEFLHDVKNWIQRNLKHAEILVVYGNL